MGCLHVGVWHVGVLHVGAGGSAPESLEDLSEGCVTEGRLK